MVAYLKEVSDPRVLLALLDDYQRVCSNFQLLKKRTDLVNDRLSNTVLMSDQLLNQFEEDEIKRKQAQVQEAEDAATSG